MGALVITCLWLCPSPTGPAFFLAFLWDSAKTRSDQACGPLPDRSGALHLVRFLLHQRHSCTPHVTSFTTPYPSPSYKPFLFSLLFHAVATTSASVLMLPIIPRCSLTGSLCSLAHPSTCASANGSCFYIS